MIGDGRGLRGHTVAIVAAVTAVLAYLALNWWAGVFGALPVPSPLVAALLVLLGLTEFAVARRIRRGVTGRDEKPLDPLWAHRMLLVAQAGALTGAVALGWYAGQLGVLATDLDATSVRTAALLCLAMCAGSGVLIAGGMRVQSAARIDGPRSGGGTGRDDDPAGEPPAQEPTR